MSRHFTPKNRFPKQKTRVSDPQDVIDEFPDDDDEMFAEVGLQRNKNNFATTNVHYSNYVGQSSKTSSVSNVEVVTPQKQKQVASGQSLHQTASFLTASVSTVKQWSRYRDEIPMLIEVFGILESLKVLDPQKSYAKQFQLQDQGGSLVCNFYEIAGSIGRCSGDWNRITEREYDCPMTDRPIPNLNIGQMLRCVGIVQRDGTLLCVSIRPATKEEYQFRNKLMAISAKAMYNRMAKRNET